MLLFPDAMSRISVLFQHKISSRLQPELHNRLKNGVNVYALAHFSIRIARNLIKYEFWLKVPPNRQPTVITLWFLILFL